MREILFRGKAIGGYGEWVYGQYLPKSKTICTETAKKGTTLYLDLFVIPETVGQYTGLTDRNGKRIFEGDIIGFGLNNCVVKYNVENGRYMLYEKGLYKRDGFNIDTMQLKEVIGNIHDNPELLDR
jgi:uncharacterized phage protein (TIGR01671 family)